VRSDAQQCATLPTRGAQAPDVPVLQVANSTVYDLKAFGRCSVTEISLIYKRDAQSAQARIPSCGRTEGAATDYQQIEFALSQCTQITYHRLPRCM